jgi:Concanavalin A-like lectin/glucanases superfamily
MCHLQALLFATVMLALRVTPLHADAVSDGTIAHWGFDEKAGDVIHDSVGHADATLSGIYRYSDGVKSGALRMDGETSSARVPAVTAPHLTSAADSSFTLSAWVALNTYPWNWVPILDQRRDESAGYMFGIDSFGRPGLQLAVNGVWQFLTAKQPLPLKRWVQVVATFDPKQGITLYVDGRQAAHRPATGNFSPAYEEELLIGRVRKPMLPSQWLHPKLPVLYSFDGLLDELAIYNRSFSAEETAADFASVPAHAGEVLPYPELPSGPKGAGPFGAYVATLKYDELWDAPRRVGPNSDVVVRFDDLPIRLVSWQGTNYIPAWVTENGKWYSDEFVETGGLPGCPLGQDCEPMSDKQNRYAHVRILESTPARAVLHFRYGLCEVEQFVCANPDPITGWADWADEYYTVYPDGVAARKQVAWTTNFAAWHEFQETIIINPPGTRPEDNIELNALTFVNMKGETATYSWEHPPVTIPRPANANIQVVNLKSRWKPFQIVSPEQPLISTYVGEKTYSIFEWWNHWPVALVKSSGISAVAPDRPSHSSLSHIEGQPFAQTANSITKVMLDGLTDKPPAELATLAASWVNPPALRVTQGGFHVQEYDKGQRAFVLARDKMQSGVPVRIIIAASPQSPLENPAFVFDQWGDGAPSLKVNGKTQEWGKDARYGLVPALEGSKLVIWLRMAATEVVSLELTGQ